MPQRSPVIFWLLLAATICVDAVAWSKAKPGPSLAEWGFDALVVAQLSVICLWSALRPSKTFWSRAAPWTASLIAALVNEPLGSSMLFWQRLPYYALHAAMLITALWLFERTPHWRRHSGARAQWQYSLWHLLMAMTLVALLTTAIRNNGLFDADWPVNFAFICGSVAIGVSSALSWSLARHWFLRLASTLGAAMLLAIVISLLLLALSDSPDAKRLLLHLLSIVGSHYLIQAAVISIWIGAGQILSPSHTNSAASGEARPPRPPER
jgi:hypothetical protein